MSAGASNGKSDTLEQIKAELNVRLEEYKSTRAEIVATLNSAYQASAITITAVGVLIAGSPSILQYQKPYLFVVASFVFYALAWAQLRYLVAVHGMSKHIIINIAPKIRESLKRISPDTSFEYADLMIWESQGRKYVHPSSKWFLPLEVARYGIPVLVAAISFMSYIFIVWQRFQVISPAEWVLMVLNATLFFYTAIVSFKVRVNRQYQYNEEQSSNSESKVNEAAIEQLIAADRPQLASHQTSINSSKLQPPSGGG